MERFYTENGRYDRDRGGTAVTLPFDRAPVDGTRAYDVSLIPADLSATTFTVQAAPTGPQTGDTCGNLTLTNTNAKGASGGTVDECWE